MKNQKYTQANQTIERLLFSQLKPSMSCKSQIDRLVPNSTKHRMQIFQMGIHYLEERFKYIPSNQWRLSSYFWSWWQQQWSLRNYELLLDLGFQINEKRITSQEFDVLYDAYLEKHALAIQIYPQRQIKRKIEKELKLYRQVA